MRELTAVERHLVAGGEAIRIPGSRIPRDVVSVAVNVDLDRDGEFDTTGTLSNGVLTTANGTQYTSWQWGTNYQFGGFQTASQPGWRNDDLEALRYDLHQASTNENIAELGQDLLALKDILDVSYWLDKILGDSAEDSEADQIRLRDRIHQIESHSNTSGGEGDTPLTLNP